MKAELILNNGRIYTLNPNQPWAEALACANGRVLAVGRSSEIEALADAHTKIIDAKGRLVLPGFTDAHIHFLQVARRSKQINLFRAASIDDVLRRVETAVQQAQPGQWIQGWGWDAHLWPDIQPQASLLDHISPDNPIVLAQMDMHSWWVNSAAMRAVNLTKETPDRPNSTIERDGQGHPIGILREWNAIELVRAHMPEDDEMVLFEWLQDSLTAAHTLGFTGIHDQRVEREGDQSFRLWQRLDKADQLKLRVHMHIAADFIPHAARLGLQAGFGNERLWLGHAKAFADGAMGSHTARMLAPYEGEPTNRGLVVTPNDKLWEFIQKAGEAGFPMSVHAIGDQAVRDVMDIFIEHLATPAGTTLSMPHRIEHVQILHPDDLPKFGHPGIVTSMQPYHLMTDWQTADSIWRPRTRYGFPMRSLIDHGATLAFGSDAPVAPMDPMAAIYAAVSRQDLDGMPAGGWQPNEKLTVAEAVTAYTMGPAQVAGKTGVQGSLAPGKWADFIILSQNLFDIPPEQIVETKVDVTVFASEIVYHR